jgi:type IV secretion system protein VirD4
LRKFVLEWDKLTMLIQDTRADELFVIARASKPIRCGRAIYCRRPEMRAKVSASRFSRA